MSLSISENLLTTFLVTISLIIYTIIYFKEFRHWLHMLQLNSYRNDRYFSWLKKNYSFSLLLLLPLLSVFFISNILMYIGGWIILNIIIFSFLNRKKSENKIPLAYTGRVKRLIIFTFILLIIIAMISFMTLNTKEAVLIVLSLLLLILPISIIFSNILISPVEKLINSYYISDAKKIITSHNSLLIIGITGSYGKTSTKFILNELFKSNYNTLMTPGSFNTLLGVTRVIREMLKPIHEVFIVEMGAKQRGDIAEICNLVSPNIAVITKIGEQHLETFGTIENIKKTKFELYDHLDKAGTAFINIDDEIIRNHSNEITRETISYSVSNLEANFYLKNISYDAEQAKTTFDLCTSNNTTLKLETKLLGKHNITNILTAVSIAFENKIPPKHIQQVIKGLKPVPHRLEIKRTNTDYIIIDNAFSSNPESAKVSLQVLHEFNGNNKILITPGMIELGEKEKEENRKFGLNASKTCDHILIIGENPGRLIFDAVINSGFSKNNCKIFKTLSDAHDYLLSIVQTNDVVLYENDLPNTYS